MTSRDCFKQQIADYTPVVITFVYVALLDNCYILEFLLVCLLIKGTDHRENKKNIYFFPSNTIFRLQGTFQYL